MNGLQSPATRRQDRTRDPITAARGLWMHRTAARRAVVANDANGAGFVVTLIPASETAPHQSTVDHRYCIRAGSSFVTAPHGVLA